ncbi:MAG: DUF2620 domain-containing protein [Clostridia bacterium]
MIRIVVGGQLAKNEIVELIERLGGDKVVVTSKNDLEGAMALKNGTVDYYFGSCNTGGGGSLAMAIALNGMDKCMTVAMPSKILSDEEIINGIKNGKVAFGFVPECLDYVVKLIMKEILKKA